jgi:hypothetical protein
VSNITPKKPEELMDERFWTLHDIAVVYKISYEYLRKVVCKEAGFPKPQFSHRKNRKYPRAKVTQFMLDRGKAKVVKERDHKIPAQVYDNTNSNNVKQNLQPAAEV